MTYSSKRTQSPPFSASSPAHKTAKANDAYFAGFAPVYRAAAGQMYVMMSWMCFSVLNSARSEFERDTKTFKVAISALALMMCVLPGTREEKTAFFEKLVAKLSERITRLRAAYIIWRQRKCWMWSGGFMGGILANLPDVFVAAHDEKSYDALIPD